MGGLDKTHQLTLKIRDIIYRFETHIDEEFATPEIKKTLEDLKNLLWDHKPFWESVGVASSYLDQFNDMDEDPEMESLRQRMKTIEGTMEYLHQTVFFRRNKEDKQE